MSERNDTKEEIRQFHSRDMKRKLISLHNMRGAFTINTMYSQEYAPRWKRLRAGEVLGLVLLLLLLIGVERYMPDSTVVPDIDDTQNF